MRQLEGKIWIAGHNGMVGRALVKRFQTSNIDILTVDSSDLDLRDKKRVFEYVQEHKPDFAILAAARVGGINANNAFPVDFLSDNLNIASNFITACNETNINRIINLGSSCIYPKYANQPIKEEELLGGHLETTNQWYAVAKIAAVKLCQAYNKQYSRSYISIMPCNLYGTNDNFELGTSHVLSAMVRKFVDAIADNLHEVTL